MGSPKPLPPKRALPPDGASEQPKKEQNAFTALMSSNRPKPKSSQRSDPRYSARNIPSVFKNRDALGAYLHDPASYTPDPVLYFNDTVVAIRDIYPKSSVHLLLLPRAPEKTLQHPFDALSDPVFLSHVKAEAAVLKRIAASELRRLFGRESHLDHARFEAMASDPPPDPEDLPAGRDWASELRVGIHAHPSMNHLHIHVISVDRHSPRMKHRKHYNSFATPFFVPLEDFPLDEDDGRRCPGREGYLGWELRCWRCGRGFGNRFAALKEHLAVEFEEWRRI